MNPVADPGGGRGPGPPAPVKTSQKKDGYHAGPQVSRVIGPPLGQISGSATGTSLILRRKNWVNQCFM